LAPGSRYGSRPLKSKDWKTSAMADDTKAPEPTAAPEQPAPEAEGPVEELEAPEIDARDLEILQLKEESGALKERLLRTAADMENLRKRKPRFTPPRISPATC
jgi:molecular chaperone GrpE (heat shock protein)